ncbi:predicted protein [Nematostella vectensis]|uniref:Protein-lysine N-methyltransferase SMYD4 n=1 Tax=Nematostella vectensis TaxID=45351 RepID=A7SM79_NEMVE|nr:predicted protein [Nematostella vectensis]|eukprot:XP_001627273.1 predicted protein [Nematostella vectensis]
MNIDTLSDTIAQGFIAKVHELLANKSSCKSKELSLRWCLAGDLAFTKSQFHRALSYYSQAIQYFPHQTGDQQSTLQICLPSILSKRAEVLFLVGEYEASLNDIAEASSLQYNHVIRDKLLKLQKSCLRKQARHSQNKNGSSGSACLSGGRHPKMANGSSLLKINYDQNQGRFLQASSEIRAGDTLIAEEPYSAVLLPENAKTHCECCYKSLVAPVPCNHCSSVLYCSAACRNKAWSQYHHVECEIFPVLEIVDTFTHLSLRILLTTSAKDIIDVLNGLSRDVATTSCSLPGCTVSGSYPGDYGSVFSLVTNSDLQPIKALMSFAMNSAFLVEFLENGTSSACIHCSQIKSDKTKVQTELDSDDDSDCSEVYNACEEQRTQNGNFEQDRTICSRNTPYSRQAYTSLGITTEEFCGKDGLSSDVVGALLVHHLQQMPCNVHAITAIVSTSSSDEEDEEMGSSHDQVVAREQRRIASAIYPTASLLNHACDPDVLVSFVDGVLVARATHNIAPGSGITHCYGPHVNHMPREERQKLLYKQYFFTCQCSACTSDEEMENTRLCFSAFACPRCKCPMKTSPLEPSLARCQNKKCTLEKSIEEELSHSRQAELLFFKAVRTMERIGVQEALGLFQECLRTRTQILHPHHKDLAETHDALARCYAMIGDFKLASQHCLQSSEAVEKAFGSTSVEYAHELHKLSQLLFNDRQAKKALPMIDKAASLLATYYGRNHPDVQELVEMKACLTSNGSVHINY